MSASAKARSVVLPIATLGEVLVHGFEVHVWCPRCHQFRRPTIPAEKLTRRFAGASLTMLAEFWLRAAISQAIVTNVRPQVSHP
jgi:hypothetical protein